MVHACYARLYVYLQLCAARACMLYSTCFQGMVGSKIHTGYGILIGHCNKVVSSVVGTSLFLESKTLNARYVFLSHILSDLIVHVHTSRGWARFRLLVVIRLLRGFYGRNSAYFWYSPVREWDSEDIIITPISFNLRTMLPMKDLRLGFT